MKTAQKLAFLVAGVLFLSGCAASDNLQTERTVFHNPLAPLVLDNGPVGPECDEKVVNRNQCFLEGAVLARNGRFAVDANGNIVRLTRKQRDSLRRREEALQSRIDVLDSLESGTAIPPASPTLNPEPKR